MSSNNSENLIEENIRRLRQKKGVSKLAKASDVSVNDLLKRGYE